MIVALLGLWLALLVAGDTPAGRFLNRWMVDWPAERLGRISRGAVLTWLMLGLVGLLMFWLLEEEGLRLFSMALPEIAGWMAAFEVGTLVDALAAVALAASALRVGAMRHWIASRLPAPRRAKRARRSRPAARASNEDEDGPALPRAA